MIHRSETPGTISIKNHITACLAAVTTIAVASFGVIYTTPLISTQFTDPIISGWIGTLASIGALTLGIVIGLLFTAVIALGLISSYAEPRVLGYGEYRVFGTSGVIGALGVLAYHIAAVVPMTSTYVPGPPDRSLVAMALIAVPLGLMFHRVGVEADASSTSRATSDQTDSHPEVPKAGPVDWDREPPTNKKPSRTAQTPTTSTDTEDTQVHDDDDSDNEDSTSSQQDRVDYSELEYDWRTQTDVSFDDVGGMDEVKEELERDVIKPLTTGKEKAEALGIPVPNILLHGPPGTGKTFLAKALASELWLPFAKLSGADVQTKWINESAGKVNQLFTEAKRVAAKEGGAVVFIDELDSVLRARDDSANSHAEDDKVVNEFLNQLQDSEDHDIVFLGSTNRPDILDEAGTRSGRIDKKIEIGEPDEDARRSIIKVQLDEKPHSLGEHAIEEFVQQTEGMVAADIHSIVMDAARESAFGRDDDVIEWQDVEYALEDK